MIVVSRFQIVSQHQTCRPQHHATDSTLGYSLGLSILSCLVAISRAAAPNDPLRPPRRRPSRQGPTQRTRGARSLPLHRGALTHGRGVPGASGVHMCGAFSSPPSIPCSVRVRVCELSALALADPPNRIADDERACSSAQHTTSHAI